jgi:hypothetical protein
MKKDIEAKKINTEWRGKTVPFESKMDQAATMLVTDQLMEPPMFALKAPRRSAISALQTG